MSCEDFRDDFEMYALGVLDPEQKAEIDAHLRTGCANCEAALKDALAVNAIMMDYWRRTWCLRLV